jgi:EAL domain-containing protein (putative c-di-GMP-specific phosphodiesterase class I)
MASPTNVAPFVEDVASPSTTASGRVLIIDDEPAVRRAWSNLLKRAGLEVDALGDGSEAVARVSTGGFDVVVSDISMPGLDGIGVLKNLRREGLDVPVILVTGVPTVETAVEAIGQGVFRYLLKPTRAADLIEAVRAAVAFRRNARIEGPEPDPRAFGQTLGSLWAAFQPIVQADGAPHGHEALLRGGEPYFPDARAVLFAAARLGRAEELGRLIRARAVRPFAVAGRLFCNLSPAELSDPLLGGAEDPLVAIAARCVLEIPERLALADLPRAQRRARELRARGFQVAVDDIGADGGALAVLAALEPGYAKIDRSVVRALQTDPVARRFAAGVVAAARSLGTKVVAVGVETEAERTIVLELGCEYLQGFLIGRPSPTT